MGKKEKRNWFLHRIKKDEDREGPHWIWRVGGEGTPKREQEAHLVLWAGVLRWRSYSPR